MPSPSWEMVAVMVAGAFGAGGGIVAYIVGLRTEQAFLRGYRCALHWLEEDDDARPPAQ